MKNKSEIASIKYISLQSLICILSILQDCAEYLCCPSNNINML